MQTSIEPIIGLEELRDRLRDRTTVLAGHSGVGKSSLIRAIQPQLDLRVGDVLADGTPVRTVECPLYSNGYPIPPWSLIPLQSLAPETPEPEPELGSEGLPLAWWGPVSLSRRAGGA